MSADQRGVKFSLCLLQPDNYSHWQAFLEVAQLLCATIEDLGHECPLKVNWVEAGAVNVVIGYQFLKPADLAAFRGRRCIFYQLEQLSEKEGWLSAEREEVLRRADVIWDYSEQNADLLRSRGFSNVYHLPLGFHPALERIRHWPEQKKDVDVLFYGARNPRRIAILERLRERCRLRTLFGVYGRERDDWIARSRVVLNIHFYDGKVLEQVRVSYLLNNRCFVVSEESENDPFAGGMVSGGYDELIALCERASADEQMRRETAERGYRLLKARPMAESLRPLVEKVPAQLSQNAAAKG